MTSAQTELEEAAVHFGSDNQKERYAAGLLPEEELCGLAREQLFKPFAGIPRWGTMTRVQAKDVRHHRQCAAGDTDIVFEAVAAGELTHDEWEAYRLIQAARDIAAVHPWLMSTNAITLAPMAHFATCRHCEAEACRTSVKVTIQWAGRELVREYVLK